MAKGIKMEGILTLVTLIGAVVFAFMPGILLGFETLVLMGLGIFWAILAVSKAEEMKILIASIAAVVLGISFAIIPGITIFDTIFANLAIAMGGTALILFVKIFARTGGIKIPGLK